MGRPPSDFNGGREARLRESLTHHERCQISKGCACGLCNGRNRFGELIDFEMPPQVLLHLVLESSDKAFRSLIDAQISNLLFSKDDGVRKAASLKCVRSLTKRRMSRIFDAYLSADRNRFYNVIFWLDMGISIPRDQAARAAENVIGSTWRDRSIDT